LTGPCVRRIVHRTEWKHVRIGIRRTARAPAGADAPTIDDVVTPNVTEGIEVYRGVATVPPEILSPDAMCGVVAIWTRRGRSPL
jgi:hypothetical protein